MARAASRRNRTGPRSRNAGGRRFSSILAKVRTHLDHFEPQVAELYGRPGGISLQADVAESQPLVERPLLRALISRVVKVYVEHFGAVPHRTHIAFDQRDFHLVPFAIRLGHISGGRISSVERAGGVDVRG